MLGESITSVKTTLKTIVAEVRSYRGRSRNLFDIPGSSVEDVLNSSGALRRSACQDGRRSNKGAWDPRWPSRRISWTVCRSTPWCSTSSSSTTAQEAPKTAEDLIRVVSVDQPVQAASESQVIDKLHALSMHSSYVSSLQVPDRSVTWQSSRSGGMRTEDWLCSSQWTRWSDVRLTGSIMIRGNLFRLSLQLFWKCSLTTSSYGTMLARVQSWTSSSKASGSAASWDTSSGTQTTALRGWLSDREALSKSQEEQGQEREAEGITRQSQGQFGRQWIQSIRRQSSQRRSCPMSRMGEDHIVQVQWEASLPILQLFNGVQVWRFM